MRFSPHFLDDIRARVSISSVVGKAVQWDRRKTNAGRGDYWACCPFHHEKTPSFHADDRKGRYHCFGCKASGDIFTFLTEKHGVPFPEAVEQLAAEAGLQMPKFSKEDEEREAERASLYDVMEMAAVFYEEYLQDPQGASAFGYLGDRGLDTKIIKTFRMGFAPNDRRALKSFLANEGITTEQMIEAGLVVHGEDIAVPYDRFRDRIMFPIRDPRGRVIAFGGRALSKDVPAKYLNSPEGPLFHKSAVLYNLDRARAPAHQKDQIIAVEGYMDVIAMARAGFDNAVAPLGTALTDQQLAQLWRMSPEPVLCFDGDEAGLKAAYRALDLALPMLKPGHSLRFALLPDGQDPDDLLQAQGREAVADVISGAQPLVDMLWQSALETNDRSTPEAKARFEVDIDQRVDRIGDQKVQHHYRSELRERVRALWSGPRQATRGRPQRRRPNISGPSFRNWRGLPEWKRAEPPSRALKALAGKSSESRSLFRREQLMLLALINHPQLLEEHVETLASISFTSRELDTLRGLVVDAAALIDPLDSEALNAHLKRSGSAPAAARLKNAVEELNSWFVLPDAALQDAKVGFRQLLELYRKAVVLEGELKRAELALADSPSEENLIHLNEVREQLQSNAGEEANIEGFGEASGRSSGAVI